MPAKLDRYRAKRDFARTAEPAGGAEIATAPHARFVVHKHAARRLHYDLRLEIGGVLKSWAVTRGPSLVPGEKRLAVEVEDHPLEYGDFEGTIPQGEYGGGTVMVWDRGYWAAQDGVDPASALADGELKFMLAGEKLVGSWVLVRMKHDREGGKRINWLLIRHRDGEGDATALSPEIDDRSVASGRRMSEIAEGRGKAPTPFVLQRNGRARADAVWHSRTEPASNSPVVPMPAFVEPQLCRLVGEPPHGADWVHEIKLDGYRMQLRVEGGEARLLTRNGLDWTHRFAAIATCAAQALPDSLIDGEVIAVDADGTHDFSDLQAALSEGRSDALSMVAFDLLFAEGADLRALPLAERKARLAAMLGRAGAALDGGVTYVGHIDEAGADILEAACAMGLEGVVSKRLDRPYHSGRSGGWTKAKCRPGQEVVIGGWSGKAGDLRSLLVGVQEAGRLRYAGRVGTGFNHRNAGELIRELRALSQPTSPFSGHGAPRGGADVSWVKPKLVAEIEHAGFTRDGMVRQAAYKGLRRDKPARQVRAEITREDRPVPKSQPKTSSTGQGRAGLVPARAAVLGITISHPDKELWPAAGSQPPLSKLELARYYEAMAQDILAHIGGRPCSIVRAPDGITGEQFFQRHATAGMSKAIHQVKVEGDRKPYLQIDTAEALVAVAQIGGVELHPWNCAVGDPQRPGRLVLDLDPGADVPFSAVIAAAKEMRERLASVGLESFCKTTGGKGLHVVTPLETRGRHAVDWPLAKSFAQAICNAMAADSPDRYLTTMTIKLRGGRIFLDYLRNDRMSTAVAVLSPRARPGATVSMPLTWAQVRSGLDPGRYTIRTAAALLARSTAWAGYDRAARPLSPAARRLLGGK
jgi:bifunctional non-homologous end joining protein LigD